LNFFEFVNSVDFAVLDFIQETMRCEFLDFVMAIFSYIGEAGGIWIISALIMMCFRKTRATGVMLLCAVAIGFLIGELGLKNTIGRLRPFVQNPEVIPIIKLPSGCSFPSGHSCASFAAATVIFTRNKKLGIPALVIASLIVFSRLYNYVHFPTDVIGGMILGVICAVVTIIFFKKTGFDKKLSGDLKYKKIEK
jgi:undecaprenyl-diphosphatase